MVEPLNRIERPDSQFLGLQGPEGPAGLFSYRQATLSPRFNIQWSCQQSMGLGSECIRHLVSRNRPSEGYEVSLGVVPYGNEARGMRLEEIPEDCNLSQPSHVRLYFVPQEDTVNSSSD